MSRLRSLPQVKVVPELMPFNGGLDVVTPPLELETGYCTAAQNYEQDINGGYARIVGYERFDGTARPSDATYTILPCSTVGSNATDGSVTVTGATSGATGVLIAAGANYIVVTKTSGTFTVTGESLTTGGTVTNGPAAIDSAPTPLLDAQYRNLAADVYRALIQKVPGSGNILGVWLYNDITYAFRNNVGGTAAAMYKSTGSGWALVPLGFELKFSTGNTALAEGVTLTGFTSGASAVITRVELESGSYAGSTAAGHFIFASITGGPFTSGENLQVSGATKAVAAAASAAITFAAPGGTFEFVNANFGGGVNTKRMYGCDGKNRAFEFDGSVFVPINTGMTTDTPQHIAAHKNQLFLSFTGSVQNSGLGQPYAWVPILGTAEIAMGDQVAGFKQLPGGQSQAALGVFTKNNISVLYGSSSADFQLNPFEQNAGAFAGTIQRLGTVVMFDNRGIASMSAVQAYGNFASATLSKRIQTLLKTKRPLVTTSCVLRDKTQYRLFFSDGTGIAVTFDNGQAASNQYAGTYNLGTGQVVGMMPFLFPVPVLCAVSEEFSDGGEGVFFGSNDGFVYQMEKGTSFDGANIEAYLVMGFNNSKGPRTLKQYRHAMLEVTGQGYAELSFSYDLGYATTDIDQTTPAQTGIEALNPGMWDVGNWDTGTWDGTTLTPTYFDMVGSAENVSIKVRSNSDYFSSTRISGAIFHYSPRRIIR